MKSQFKSLVINAPLVVRDRIFSLLDNRTKLSLRLVCQGWKQLLDQIIPFRIILNQQTFGFMEKFVQTHKVGELVITYFPQPIPVGGFDFQPDALTLLSEGSEKCLSEKGKYSSKHPVHQRESPLLLPQHKLALIFSSFSGMEKLSLVSSALADLKPHSFLRHVEFFKLKHLEIITEGNVGLDGIEELLLHTFPSLTKFHLTIYNEDDMTLYAPVYHFMSKQPKTLKDFKRKVVPPVLSSSTSIHLKSMRKSSNEDLAYMQWDHRLDAVTYAQTVHKLKTKKLKFLELHALSSEGCLRKNFELHLLRAQSNLTFLNLTNLRKGNMPVWRTVPAILDRCSTTLKSISLDGCFCNKDLTDPPGPFWCHWVEKCTKLQKLEVLICGIKVVDMGLIPRRYLKTLCLGHMLVESQIRFMLDPTNFKYLEAVSLPQMNVDSSYAIPQYHETGKGPKEISIHHFRRALLHPKITQLSLWGNSCNLKSIRRYAGGLVGIYENLTIGKKNGDVEYTIDRQLFQLSLRDLHKKPKYGQGSKNARKSKSSKLLKTAKKSNTSQHGAERSQSKNDNYSAH